MTEPARSEELLRSLQADVAELKGRLEALTGDGPDLQDANARLRAQVAQLRSRGAMLEEELAEVAAERDELQAEHATAQQLLEAERARQVELVESQSYRLGNLVVRIVKLTWLRRLLGVVRRRGRRAAGRPPATGKRPEGATRPVSRTSVPVGRHLSTEQDTDLAVTLVVVLGVAGDELEDLVRRVAEWQTVTIGFRPVFVTTAERFEAFRRHGFLFEYVMGPQQWSAFADPAGWHPFVARRLSAIVADYRPDSVVVLGDAGWSTADVLGLRLR